MKKTKLVVMVFGLLICSTALADGRLSYYYNGPVMEPIYTSGPLDSHYNDVGLDPIYDSNELDKMYNDPALEPIPTLGPIDRTYNGPGLEPKYDVEYRDGHRSKYIKVKSQKVAE